MTLPVRAVVKALVYTTRTTCRLCGSEELQLLWSIGETPLANNYLTVNEAAAGVQEPFAPLDVYYCTDCSLVQLRDVVDPRALFSHYLYVSSTSAAFVTHFEQYGEHLRQRFGLSPVDLVVDVGSNDGVLLKPLQRAGVRVLGVDPAENVAAAAQAAGIPTRAAFFTPELAVVLRREQGTAQVITANNVFAHTDDIYGFVAAVKELLSSDGAFVFEVQYVRDLVEQNLFDVVYHEHVNYYHLAPLARYFREQHGMEVFDVQRQPVHGGSIRVFVQRAGGPHTVTPAVSQLQREEALAGFNSPVPYLALAQRIAQNKQRLRQLLGELQQQGKRVVGYGAPAKATTLMYAFGLNQKDLAYIVEDAPLKQGRLMPGTHVPIVGPERLYEDQPDYCLILAWNFSDLIMKNHRRFTANGGQWIVPVPEPRLVTT